MLLKTPEIFGRILSFYICIIEYKVCSELHLGYIFTKIDSIIDFNSVVKMNERLHELTFKIQKFVSFVT